MARQRSRNPRNRRKRRRDAGDDDDDTSDSDFNLDDNSEELDLEDEADGNDLQEIVIPQPPIPRAPIRRKPRRKDIDSGDPNLKWKVLERENTRWLDEHEQEVEDGDRPMPETADPSPAVILPLLRFQKEFLAWALKQEKSEVRGGILADEMGMGKTIQAISLVLTARDQKSDGLELSCSSRSWATLVICPVVAVIQWVGEIDRYTEKGSARVLVYHGPKREKAEFDFTKYDFVITTYQTIECDYRKYLMPLGMKCIFCGRRYNVRSMKIHLKYHCGPNARKTRKQSKQVKKKKGDIKTGKGDGIEHGKQKMKNVVDDELDDHRDKPRGVSLLHSVQWERIILDEVNHYS